VVSRVPGISFVYFTERDVVRHTLVQRIIRAYEEYDQARIAVGANNKNH
jgi:phosphate starvation-inducible PhoH-like protein